MLNIPQEWKNAAFWASVLVAGLNAALEQKEGTPHWRMGAHVMIAVLPLVFVKALHNDNRAAIAKMRNGHGSDDLQREAKD